MRSARPVFPIAAATKALIGAAAASLYYWRFRLPFALLPIAASLVLFAMALIRLAAGELGPDRMVDPHVDLRPYGLCRRHDIRHVSIAIA